ncbi:MAG: amino acid permease-associated region [Planctomycetaceae bacterium]|nr:amino acid permease-associated region [Planctomycetaceae bacterium]
MKSTKLVRGLGLWQAVSLNVANMVGIGPFVTIPLFIKAMNGPQALIAWVIAAILVTCDGLVWSELGAALPGSGGTYHFHKEIFGRAGSRWGRAMPFLFIWQFLISGTAEMASGYIGAIDYLKYLLPDLESTLASWGLTGGSSWIAAGACVTVTIVLCRRIQTIGWLGVALCAGTLITVCIVIVCGLLNFNPCLLTLPENAGNWQDPGFATGLGAAMLIAIYDYFGYYNVCHLGDEVQDPGRTIPRAVIISVALVAGIYLVMNVSIIAVVPWQEAMESTNIAADFMERLYGRPVAMAFTCLILWTAAACMFAITLGYSRIPYAAALNGDFFPVFAKLHPEKNYPVASLWTLCGLTAIFCFFPLKIVVDSAVTVRILIQFVAQIFGLQLLRMTRPDIRMPFRMWLYPLPSLLALCGWLFILATSAREALIVTAAVTVSGILVYLLVQWGKMPTPGERPA